MKFKLYKNYFLLILIMFIVIIVGLELLTRGYFIISKKDIKAFKNYPGRYTSSSFTGYKLTPNWELNHDTLKEKINSLGFKNPEININKDKGTYRIICIGGSLVYGRDNIDGTWPHFLGQIYDSNISSTQNIEVINAGVPGYTSFHSMTQLTTKLIDLEPDLIISYQLFTDLWYYNSLRKDVIIGDNFSIYNSGFTFGRMIDKSYFIVLCNAILKKYFSKIPDNEKLPSSLEEKIFNDDVLIYYNRNIDIMASLCQMFEIDLLLCPPISLFKENNTLEEEIMIMDIENKEFYLDYIKAGKDILKTISEKYGRVRYFDPSTKIVSTLNLLSDRYHPNVEGNKRIAKEIHSFIEK